VNLSSHALTRSAHGEGANEDGFLADDAHGLYVVSDGVGRYRGAATASRLVVETVAHELRRDPPETAEAVRAWLLGSAKKAAAALALEAKKDRKLASMSATLTALRVIGEDGYLLHVGDSRAYRWRGGRIEQLTRDHSLAFEQYELGAITKEALRTHPNQKLLTRTLRASSSIVLPELTCTPLRAGDRLLLCTDGLTKVLPDTSIGDELARDADLRSTSERLLDATRDATEPDDTTLVLVSVAS
jgi:serine/threonine protein phosphatase PrpC